MTHYYLIENYNPVMALDQGEIVALDPRVSHELHQSRIPHTLLEDYCSERSLRLYGVGYFEQFLEWCGRLDVLTRPYLPMGFFRKPTLSRIFFSRLKYLVDDIIIRSRCVLEFVEKTKPSQITFIRTKEPEAPPSMYDFFSQRRNSFSPFFIRAAEHTGHFKMELLEFPLLSRHGEIQKGKNGISKRRWFSPTRDFLKAAYNSIRLRKFRSFLREKVPFNVLFVDAGTFEINYVITKAIKTLQRVFLLSNDTIYRIDSLVERKALILEKSAGEYTKWKETCLEAFTALKRDSHFSSWINHHSEMDVSDWTLPYFEDWMGEILPKKICHAFQLKDFFDHNGIKAVIARAGSNLHHTAPLIAASGGESPLKVCFQHGMGPDLEDYAIELDLFDAYYATDPLSKSYFEARSCESWISPCEIRQSAHQLRKTSIFKTLKRSPKIVVFLPRHHNTPIRHFQNMGYPWVWYYRLQRALIDLFSERDDYVFIYKYTPGQTWLEKSLLPYIQSKGKAHLKTACGPLWRYLKIAGRMIQDSPSSPLYEAAAAGIPVFSLYYETEPLGEKAKHYFEKSLCPFLTIAEGIAAVDHFLSENPEKYRVYFPRLEDAYSDSFFGLTLYG